MASRVAHHASRAPFRARLCVWAAALASAAFAADQAPPRLHIEYLPVLVEEGQPLSVCARAEGEGAVRLSLALRDAAGKALASSTGDGAPKAGAPWRYRAELATARGSPAALDIVLATQGDGRELARVAVRVLGARQPLPALGVKGMGLVDEAGQGVIALVEKRSRKPEERWPLVRWARHKLYGDRWGFRQVLVLGADLGAPDDGYLARLAAAKARWTTSVVAVPSRVEEPTLPVLRAVAALSKAKLDPTPDLAVLCLGHRDVDYGTDVLLFGQALELILQQLEGRGCRQFVLVAPVGPSHLRERLAPYAKATERAAFVYRGKFLDLTDSLADKHWAGPGDDDRLLLRFPNAAGHQALAEALSRHLRKIRR